MPRRNPEDVGSSVRSRPILSSWSIGTQGSRLARSKPQTSLRDGRSAGLVIAWIELFLAALSLAHAGTLDRLPVDAGLPYKDQRRTIVLKMVPLYAARIEILRRQFPKGRLHRVLPHFDHLLAANAHRHISFPYQRNVIIITIIEN